MTVSTSSLGFLFALSLAPLLSHAGSSELYSLQVPFAADAAKIDGELSDPVWQKAAVATLDFETEPAENGPAPVMTEAKLYASDTTLYVAFIAKDPNPKAIRAHLRPRDNVWSEDLVGLKLDTFNNARLAYNFFVNPLGVQGDTIENELTKEESEAWDGIWESAGRLTDDGYQVEIAIPLSQLSFENKAGSKQWGFELIRYYPRDSEHRLSSNKISRANSCVLCQIGVVSGFETVNLGRGLQLTPSLVAKGSREREQASGSEWSDDNQVDAGLDLRWTVNPSTLVNATINPDFSQVEADDGQLNVNSDFSLSLKEKRSFFLDNTDYFDSQLPLLHTRNIADPDYGVKFTQKSEAYTLAFLGTNDSSSHFMVPGNLSSSVATLDEVSHNLAGRYLYTATEALAIGATLTGKQSENHHNTVVSADVKYQPTSQDTFIAQVAGSDTEYPVALYRDFCSGDSDCLQELPCTNGKCGVNERVLRTHKDGAFGGQMYKLGYKHATRDYFLRADYQSVGEDFRADLGFVDKVDQRRAVAGGGYVWYPTNSWFTEVELGGDWDITQNQHGEQIEQELEGYIAADAGWQSFWGMGWAIRDRVGKRLDGSKLAIEGNTNEFTETRLWLESSIAPVTWLEAELELGFGDEIDIANNRLGNGFDVEGAVELKLTDSLALEVNHNLYTLDVDGGQLLRANLTDVRLNWQLSVESFVRLSSIYTHIKRNPSLYLYQNPDKLSEDLGTELLFGYKVNPLSVFYLGYGDNMVADDSYPGLTRTEQTLFMKMSYAFIL